jgi:hypothetical protein
MEWSVANSKYEDELGLPAFPGIVCKVSFLSEWPSQELFIFALSSQDRFPSFTKSVPNHRVSSAKGVHLAGILLPVTKTEKCTRCVQGIAIYQI